ncbi:MAG: hypothetical protein KDD69_13555 [Bdellovibrionales bacterium]|nr:hypothetical protein [Bdellovibrionales bacterium]
MNANAGSLRPLAAIARAGRAQSGSLSLGMLYSTAAGVLFILLFYNLTSFVGATAAVREAARVTARCITPTDPECVQLVAEAEGSVAQEWFGFEGGAENEAVDVSVVQYQYGANMVRSSWGVEYDTFEIQRAVQPVTLNSYPVPVELVEVGLNPAVIPEEVSIDAAYRRPASLSYTPDFPAYPSATRDEGLPPAQWLTTQPPGFRVALESAEVVIAPGDEFVFATPRIEIPQLAGRELPEADAATCLEASGAACDNATPAGGQNAAFSWRDSAYVSIKVLAQIRSADGRTTQVKWGEVGDGPGLWLNVSDPQQGSSRICLGGRTWSGGIGAEPVGYNLWLRGPNGANGGTEAVCPGGDVDHSNLRIGRGGSFSVDAVLKTHASASPAVAKVWVYYFFDSYKPDYRPEETKDCERKLVRSHPSSAACPTFQDCQANDDDSDVTGWELAHCTKEMTRSTATCEVSEDTVPVDGPLSLGPFPILACGTSVSASLDKLGLSIPPGRIECPPRRRVGTTTVALLSSPAACGPIESSPLALECGKPVIVGTTPSVKDCPTLDAAIADMTRAAESIPNLPAVAARPEITFGEQRSFFWDEAWLPLDDQGKMLPVDGRQARSRLHAFPLDPDGGPYKKIGETLRNPPAVSDLAQAVAQHADLETSGASWERYRANIAQHARLKEVLTKVPVTEVYPFAAPVPELYWGQHDPEKGWDFNRDCTRDASCGAGGTTFESLEQMLRHYAASAIPEANDPHYVFETAAPVQVGIRHFGANTRAEAAQLDLPSCTPTRTICGGMVQEGSRLVSLGQSDAAPASCSDGTYHDCFAKPVGSAVTEAAFNRTLDMALAHEMGLRELQRIFPGAHGSPSCEPNDPGCASVDVEILSEERALVTVSYNMPLSFPLDAVLQRPLLPVRYQKEETLERASVGFRK